MTDLSQQNKNHSNWVKPYRRSFFAFDYCRLGCCYETSRMNFDLIFRCYVEKSISQGYCRLGSSMLLPEPRIVVRYLLPLATVTSRDYFVGSCWVECWALLFRCCHTSLVGCCFCSVSSILLDGSGTKPGNAKSLS